MCKVYEFPVKKELPKELEERLQKVAKEYVEIVNEALSYFEDDNATEEEAAKFMESVLQVYMGAIMNAVDEV